MKGWVTKYALTVGIQEEDFDPPRDGSNYVYTRNNAFNGFFLGKDAHTDRQQAVARAEEMRKSKIDCLKKQLDKLESMDFK